MISNLLSNAIKFTNEGTVSITADAAPNTNEIVVSITDTGRGIDSEILPRLNLPRNLEAVPDLVSSYQKA